MTGDGSSLPENYRVVGSTIDFAVPHSWLLIAYHDSVDSVIRWCTGETTRAGTSTATNNIQTQVGIAPTGTMVAATDKDVVIVFDEPFLSAPVVSVTARSGTTAAGGISLTIQTPTTTGVTVNARRATGTTSFDVHWQAFGPM